MDLIRSCYSTDIAMFKDDPDALTRITWYFVPSDRKIMNYPTPFRSRVWDVKDEPPTDLGERYDDRPWSNGQIHQPVAKAGACGTIEQWADGALTTDPLPAKWPGTPVPRCCQHPPEYAQFKFGIGNLPIGDCSDAILNLPDETRITFHKLSGNPDPCFDGRTYRFYRAPLPCIGTNYISDNFESELFPPLLFQWNWSCTGFVASTYTELGMNPTGDCFSLGYRFYNFVFVSAFPLFAYVDFTMPLGWPEGLCRAYWTR